MLAILGVLLSIGLASLRPADEFQVDSFVDELAGYVQKARFTAVTESSFVLVQASAAGLSTTLDTNRDRVFDASDRALVPLSLDDYPLVSMTNIVGGGLVFEPRGVAYTLSPESSATSFDVVSSRDATYGWTVSWTGQGALEKVKK